jgi:hypothetical protein
MRTRTVYNYDRRGSGESADTQAYAVDRETLISDPDAMGLMWSAAVRSKSS